MKRKIHNDELKALVAAGWTSKQIAASLGADISTVQKRRKMLGINNPGGANTKKLDRDQVKALVEQGLTNTQIAQRLHCHIDSVSRVRTELGISHEYRGKPMTPERLERIRQMIADGWSHAEIHRTEGADRDTLAKYFPGTAWTREQQNEHQSTIARMTHFNRRPRHYDTSKYETARTLPTGSRATKPTTLEAAHAQHGATRGRSVEKVRGGVIGHAA